MSKFKNVAVMYHGERFDSKKELRVYLAYLQAKLAVDPRERVIKIMRQVSFTVIPKQCGERAAVYTADFVVDYADGRQEVVDVKSPPTRKLDGYVLRRKLMLHVHAIRLVEV